MCISFFFSLPIDFNLRSFSNSLREGIYVHLCIRFVLVCVSFCNYIRDCTYIQCTYNKFFIFSFFLFLFILFLTLTFCCIQLLLLPQLHRRPMLCLQQEQSAERQQRNATASDKLMVYLKNIYNEPAIDNTLNNNHAPMLSTKFCFSSLDFFFLTFSSF